MGLRCALVGMMVVAAGCSSTHNPGGPVCEVQYRMVAMDIGARCAIAADAAEPCRDAARCLCEAWVDGGVGDDVDACVESWLTPRGAITLADFCTAPSRAEAMPLSDALEGFAAAYGDEVSVSDVCDDTPAYAGY